jgi:hypothetical protein
MHGLGHAAYGHLNYGASQSLRGGQRVTGGLLQGGRAEPGARQGEDSALGDSGIGQVGRNPTGGVNDS